MGDATPVDEARHLIVDYFNYVKALETAQLVFDDVYVVWFCYILGGWKALVSTTVRDNMYYEVTHNVEKNETYVDAYRKIDNVVVGHTGRFEQGLAIYKNP